MSLSKVRMKQNKRMYAMLAVCVLLLLALTVRTGYLQVVKGENLQKQAIEQQTRDRIINSKRGTVYDRNGKQLAVSASVETVTASPAEVKANSNRIAVEKVAAGLADVLGMGYEEVYEKISKIHYMK